MMNLMIHLSRIVQIKNYLRIKVIVLETHKQRAYQYSKAPDFNLKETKFQGYKTIEQI